MSAEQWPVSLRIDEMFTCKACAMLQTVTSLKSEHSLDLSVNKQDKPKTKASKRSTSGLTILGPDSGAI